MTTRKHEREAEVQATEPVDDHECEFDDVAEGPDVVGKVCTICGAMKDYSENER